MIVLKISCNSEIHRVQLDQDSDYNSIYTAVQGLWPNYSIRWMKYIDEEGDLCTLVDATFTDFMQTAQETGCGRPMMKVQVACVPLLVATEEMDLLADYVDVEAEEQHRMAQEEEQARQKEEDRKQLEELLQLAEEKRLEAESDSSLDDWEFVECDQLSSASTSSCVEAAAIKSEAVDIDDQDDTMKEIQSELNRIKAACEAELERHLDEWLETTNAQASYEDWIAAVHPENVKETLLSGYIIDQRMYLDGSFHRQLWNQRIEGLPGLSEAEKQRCHVFPREPRSTTTSPEVTRHAFLA